MIFNKDVTFPYPILTNFNDDYPNSDFSLQVDFQTEDENYFFNITYQLTSMYLMSLYQNHKAQFKCIVQSYDSKIYDFNPSEPIIRIPKNRITLSKRVLIQLAIVTTEEVSFDKNQDIDPFYKKYRNQITIDKNHLLALSNIAKFNGELKEPFKLFNYSIINDLQTDIAFDLEKETIHIKFKESHFLHQKGQKPSPLNYHYVYIGLQKAISQFIINNFDEGENIQLRELTNVNSSLDEKLLSFMINKGVEEVSLEKIDLVIHQITDRIIYKHNKAVLRGNT